MSKIKDNAIEAFNLFKDQTSTPLTSFQAPNAARPANATRPRTALTSMPEL